MAFKKKAIAKLLHDEKGQNALREKLIASSLRTKADRLKN